MPTLLRHPASRAGRLAGLLLLAATLLAACATPPKIEAPAFEEAAQAPAGPPRPLVIAHRGASALRPEHTIAAYQKAIQDGADVIECDLVMTRDGVLVARHENDITQTTNVAELPQFADRKHTKVVDGDRRSGWFTEDFTLAELKTLRARERLPQWRAGSARYNDRYEIPTFDEIVVAVGQAADKAGRPIGLYPELKSPSYFRSLGLPLESALITALRRPGYTQQAPVFVQSFESSALRNVRKQVGKSMPNLKVVQLTGNPSQRPADWRLAGDNRTYADMFTPTGLREIATYADAIGPAKTSVIPHDAQGGLGEPTELVGQAHAAGLQVHPYTFRPENTFLPKMLQGQGGEGTRSPDGMVREVQAHLAAGVDGFFTDDPAVGRRAVDEMPR